MTKTALITGASTGIGEEFARVLAQDGFDLVLVARRRERLESLAAALASECSVRVHVVPDDLSDPAAPARIHAALCQLGLHIDMLVNNAGAGIKQTFARAKWSEHAQLMQVQVVAPAHLTHLLLPAMIERGYGRVIHVSSLAGLMPGAPASTLYPAAKSFGCIPVLSVDVDVAVDERGNRVRKKPQSRIWATKLKVCLGLRSLMRISVRSSLLRLLPV